MFISVYFADLFPPNQYLIFILYIMIFTLEEKYHTIFF